MSYAVCGSSLQQPKRAKTVFRVVKTNCQDSLAIYKVLPPRGSAGSASVGTIHGYLSPHINPVFQINLSRSQVPTEPRNTVCRGMRYILYTQRATRSFRRVRFHMKHHQSHNGIGLNVLALKDFGKGP